MKFNRQIILVAVLILTLFMSNLIDGTKNSNRFSKSFPAVLCPPNPAGLTTISSVASKNSLSYRVGSKSVKLTKIKTNRYSSVSDPVLIQSEGSTPVAFQSRNSVFAGSVICSAPVTSQWFVGGTSDVSSKGHLDIVNSGLSSSIIDIFTWSENGEQGIKTISLKANSITTVKLDTLSPGDKNIVIKVVARSGRVSSFLIDERSKGLKSLGGDSVNSISAPSQKTVIVGVVQEFVKKKVPNHYLRLFVPGVADANFTLELLSSDGRFIPVGFNERKLPSGKVVELKFSPEVKKGFFALKITSDQPLLAAIRSRASSNGKSDFVWSTPSQVLAPFELGVAGISPKLIFTGDSIAVNLGLTYSSGKVQQKVITGSDLLSWQVPNNVVSIRINSASKESYAGAVIFARSGLAFFPISSGAEISRAAIPASNIEVLNP